MSAGQANQPQTAQLMQGLLKRTRPAARQARRRLLAVSCLQEVRSLDPELLQAVEQVIPSLLPPRSQYQAEQLSSAGEALIPLLARYWTRDVKRISYTIRAASLVGGSLALDLITNAISQNPPAERNDALKGEIMRAWQYFDTEDYARRILPIIKSENLIIDELPKVAPWLSYATSVRHFLINPFSGIANLQGLAELPHLRRLSFANLRAAQLVGLSECRNIESLSIFGYDSRDLSDLQIPPALKSLFIADSRRIGSLTGIEQASSLVHLVIRNCPEIKNLDILSGLPNLKTVRVYEPELVEVDITALLFRSDLDVKLIKSREQSPRLDYTEEVSETG